ncbi:hypothetical protein REBECCA_216 [Erwinia phage Rebecca]|uniref:Uncharacterized protein n=5 Tax=Agricanvirus TaxID=1984776 RepID=A0A173GDW0_9CAUD|nr:hypothetical protein FDH97_gp219 [Erwinia phage vB_EamM_Deimos-Minion]YP_009606002.1 hypothetical protein FDH99_gp307 [Erwinia phage vB_EamM_Simmy50]AUG86002.1 hypothetical protein BOSOLAPHORUS_216 [Erwinia phage vB_EamM_Bosolaphorus]AUG86967.1 hypothetical protein MORTIMER_219 [Erwinia phage vB_EamM_Mortimer]QBP07321.1 hypothetical protein REBECCA_216 [Erwinia phage Rebecca]ANH51678.1 hypothetical protein SIMMY50_219 [Erwinia phage vB_EamM_Simmy50]ANH52319.1 hypothetical protein DM_219 [E
MQQQELTVHPFSPAFIPQPIHTPFIVDMPDLISWLKTPVKGDPNDPDRIDTTSIYVPPEVEMKPVAIIDLFGLSWTNHGGLLTMFSQVNLFDLFVEVIHKSLGQPSYNLYLLNEWIEAMMGVGDYFDPETNLPQPSMEEVMVMQDALMRMFCDFVVNNQSFIMKVLQPLLVNQAVDTISLQQLKAGGSIVVNLG